LANPIIPIAIAASIFSLAGFIVWYVDAPIAPGPAAQALVIGVGALIVAILAWVAALMAGRSSGI
jgi:hypothetical protein